MLKFKDRNMTGFSGKQQLVTSHRENAFMSNTATNRERKLEIAS